MTEAELETYITGHTKGTRKGGELKIGTNGIDTAVVAEKRTATETVTIRDNSPADSGQAESIRLTASLRCL